MDTTFSYSEAIMLSEIKNYFNLSHSQRMPKTIIVGVILLLIIAAMY